MGLAMITWTFGLVRGGVEHNFVHLIKEVSI